MFLRSIYFKYLKNNFGKAYFNMSVVIQYSVNVQVFTLSIQLHSSLSELNLSRYINIV